MVVGGYSGNELAPMNPFVLDLETFTWSRGPREGCRQRGRLPQPRQRAACMRVGYWLLVHGGATANVRVVTQWVRVDNPVHVTGRELQWHAPPAPAESDMAT